MMEVIAAIQKVAAKSADWPKTPWAKRLDKARHFLQICEKSSTEFESLLSESLGYPQWAAAQEWQESLRAGYYYCEKGEKQKSAMPRGLLACGLMADSPVYRFFSLVLPGALLGNHMVVMTDKKQYPILHELVSLFQLHFESPEVIQLLVDPGDESFSTLAQHPAVKGLLFFGDKNIGDRLRRWLCESPSFLHTETGGRNPVIIGRGLDFAQYGEELMKVLFSTHYMSSFRGSRVFLPENQWDVLCGEVEKLAEAARKEKFAIDIQVTKDASNCSPTQQEILPGGQITLTRYKNIAEATKFANTSPWGQAAYIFNHDEEKARKAGENLRVGHVFVNKFVHDLHSLEIHRYGFSGVTSGREYWQTLQMKKTLG